MTTISTNPNLTFTMPESDVQISANFKRSSYNVTLFSYATYDNGISSIPGIAIKEKVIQFEPGIQHIYRNDILIPSNMFHPIALIKLQTDDDTIVFTRNFDKYQSDFYYQFEMPEKDFDIHCWWQNGTLINLSGITDRNVPAAEVITYGQKFPISAGTPAAGKIFSKWSIDLNNRSKISLDNPNSPNTNIYCTNFNDPNMPYDVTVTAIWKTA